MNIAITGATGFIGRHYLEECGNQHSITVLTTQNNEIKNVADERYIYCDYTIESIKQCIAGCDAIIHMAGVRSPVGKSDNISYYFDNMRISENLFVAAMESGINNIVVLSSISVYSSILQRPFIEEITQPFSLYGASKLAVENIAAVYNRKYGLKIKSLRLAQVMGTGERRNLMTIYLENSLAHKTLDVFGTGSSIKTYIYVKDVVQAIENALTAVEISGAFNIGMSKGYSNLQLAQTYCEVFDNQDNYRLLSDKKEDGEIWEMDISRAAEMLSFVPKYDLKRTLIDIKILLKK